jgi:hypothetical protein
MVYGLESFEQPMKSISKLLNSSHETKSITTNLHQQFWSIKCGLEDRVYRHEEVIKFNNWCDETFVLFVICGVRILQASTTTMKNTRSVRPSHKVSSSESSFENSISLSINSSLCAFSSLTRSKNKKRQNMHLVLILNGNCSNGIRRIERIYIQSPHRLPIVLALQ